MSFEIVEHGHAARGSGVPLELEENIKLSYDRLQNYCVTQLSGVDVDLLVLLGAVAFADRAVPRHRATVWGRQITLSVPVHEVEKWRDPEVEERLHDLLSYATGDTWSISFRRRRRSDDRALQLSLELKAQAATSKPLVIPFSGGIDSWAALRGALQTGREIWLVATATNTSIRSLVERVRGSASNQVRCLLLPVEFHKLPRGAEPTFRSRTMLFFGQAALAAKLGGASSVVVGENGQGALGSALITSGLDHPFVSLHPGLTTRLAKLLHLLWGHRLQFDHPHLFETKAEMMERSASLGAGGLSATFSCSYNTTRHQQLQKRVHCGICGNCLLRRQASFNAPLAAAVLPKDDYLWQDLRAKSLAGSTALRRKSGEPVATRASDIELAETAVLEHQRLAEIASSPDSVLVRRYVADLALSLDKGRDETRAALLRLLEAHAVEWMRFTSSLGKRSWINDCIRRAA